MANKRVIDLPDLSQEVQEGQYVLVDSAGGTGKMDLKHIVDEAGSFDPAGEYPELYAGNMTTDKAQTDKTPYIFRKTGGNLSRVGERCYDTVIGASVGENQLVQNGDFLNGTTGWSKGNTSSWEVTSDGIDVTVTQADNLLLKEFNYLPHKYVCLVALKLTTATTNVGIRFGRSPYQWKGCEATTSRQVVAGIFSITETYNDYIRFPDLRSSGWDKVHFYSISIIDLTALLGTSIADYIYSLESATAGSGIAKLRSWGFLRGYQAYNAGSLESVEVTGKKVVGFNQVDLAEFARQYPTACQMNGDELTLTTDVILYHNGISVEIPSETTGAFITYEVKTVNATSVRVRIVYEDGTMEDCTAQTSSTYVTVTKELKTKRIVAVRFNWNNSGTFNVRNLCINLSNPDRNGEYEPYTSQTYDYGDDTLRGIFKLDASNNLYAYGDRKTADGLITRKMNLVDLGTLNWEYRSDVAPGLFSCREFSNYMHSEDVSCICNKYMYVGTADSVSEAGNKPDKTICLFYNSAYPSSSALYIKDTSFTDATTFKQMLTDDNVQAVYELATPTTEQGDPFPSPQVCYPDGTEEYTTSNGVPVGHETEYPYDLKGLVEGLIDVPDVPSANGTYVLKATRSASGVAYNWVAG